VLCPERGFVFARRRIAAQARLAGVLQRHVRFVDPDAPAVLSRLVLAEGEVEAQPAPVADGGVVVVGGLATDTADRRRFGRVPVFADIAKESGVAMIGCDAGVNGDGLDALKDIGTEIYQRYGLSLLNDVVDRVCARMALRLVDIAVAEHLVLPNSSIGFTGRAAISGRKPEYILDGITERKLFDDPNDHLVFVDDGLARGAALMGRCMNSLGKPKNPIGGVRGGPCIMSRRIKAGK